MPKYLCVVFTSIFALSGCGTLTGLPAHGGGKRFAIEQELVAATARAAAKDLDVSALRGKRLSVSIMGLEDHGGGNIVGGRYSIAALLRGETISTPTTEYPVVSTSAVSGGTTTTAQTALNAPLRTKGEGYRGEAGIGYNGLGAYGNTVISQNLQDAVFLARVIATAFSLRGLEIVPDDVADTDVSILVDVFGTIRQRHDWHVANQESLIAKTALEISAIDRASGEIVLAPQSTSFEAEYNEQYVFWAGPVKTMKQVRRSNPLLVDFSDMNNTETNTEVGYLKVPLQTGSRTSLIEE